MARKTMRVIGRVDRPVEPTEKKKPAKKKNPARIGAVSFPLLRPLEKEIIEAHNRQESAGTMKRWINKRGVKVSERLVQDFINKLIAEKKDQEKNQEDYVAPVQRAFRENQDAARPTQENHLEDD